MATPVWSPGTPYPTGSLVQPLTPIAPVPTALTNPGFDTGNTTGWTFSGAGTYAVTTLNSQAGTYNLGLDNGEVIGQNDEFPATPGLTINASIYVRLSSSGTSAGRVRLWWFDAAHVQIGSPVDGALIQKPGSSSERWVLSSLSAVAPALTAYVRVGFWSNSGVGGGDTRVDSLSWDYTSATSPTGLIFEATQVGLGISAGTEPVWPSSPGIPVNDGSVVWEGIIANRVIWEGKPIMVSGATEPDWPTVVGESETDNTVSWETVSLRVEDENCPNSKVVTIASSKVYAADEDLVRYCATVNPLDWTSADDAGYLATGLNQYGSNRTAVLNTYRSNVVPFSASTFQNWQVDPDPANITLLDSMEGIGSTYQQAAHPVANELFYLSPLGVRTVGIAAGTANLAAGDAGAPIDPLVEGALRTVGVRPLAAYYPNQGQYWLIMRPPLPVVIGPTISGEAPDGVAGVPYPGFAYTITPGDAPIFDVYISDGELPSEIPFAYPPGSIAAGTPLRGGTYDIEITGVDENGLSYVHADSIYIKPTWEWVQDFGNDLRGIASDDSGHIIVAANGVANVGQLWETDEEAQVYTQIPGIPVQAIYTIAWGEIGSTGYWVAGSNTSTVLVSTDRVTWTSYPTANGNSAECTIFAGDRFMRVGNAGNAEYATNPTGTWLSQSIGVSSETRALVADPDVAPGDPYIVCAFLANGSIRRTTDGGVTWNSVTISGADPHAATGFGRFAATLHNGEFLGFKSTSTTTITVYRSIDQGVTFTATDVTVASNAYSSGAAMESIDTSVFGFKSSVLSPDYVQLFDFTDGLGPLTPAILIPGLATLEGSSPIDMHDNNNGTGVAICGYSGGGGYAYRYRYGA